MSRVRARQEGGVALIVTVLLLVLITVMGFAALDTVTRDQQVAGFQNRSRLAFYAAEAGVAEAKNALRAIFSTDQTVAFPDETGPVAIGDTALFPSGQPVYYGDPAATGGGVVNVPGSTLSIVGEDARIGEEGFENTLWRIRVVGSTPDGVTSRLDVLATRKLGNGS